MAQISGKAISLRAQSPVPVTLLSISLTEFKKTDSKVIFKTQILSLLFHLNKRKWFLNHPIIYCHLQATATRTHKLSLTLDTWAADVGHHNYHFHFFPL